MVKTIFDTIAALSGKNDKIAELKKHADNDVLKRAIYLAQSPRVNFYIKQIPEYENTLDKSMPLEWAFEQLEDIINREVTGGEAKNHLSYILSSLSSDDAIVIERIIGKNCKIGMDSGINKALGKLIEETPYQGAKSFSEKGAKKLFDKLKDGEFVISQIKADGTYRNNIIQDNQVQLLSRQGEISFLSGTKFLDELTNFPDGVLNGELTIDGFKRTEANGMVSSMMDIIEKADERGEAKTTKKKEAFEKKHGSFEDALSKLRLTVWDMITIDEYSEAKSSTPYIERFRALEELLKGQNTTMIDLVETRFITTFEEAMEHFLDAQSRGLEGTIIKSSTDGWKDGKPTYQIKMKLEMHMDLRIIGFNYGTVGTKNEHVISALQLESECGLLKTTPAGMKEKMMADITERQEELMGTVVEIRCCGLSQNSDGEWSTAHPSIVELRTDKDTCDTLESCKEIEEMAKGLEKKID
jgi:DNA ligase-1